MNMVKRGLIALSVVAAVGGTTGGLLASAASASPTRGVEVIHTVQYSVAGGPGVGPWTGHGPISTHKGNITDIPSLATDPANSSRTTLIDPAGSFTTLNTGGNFIPGRTNPFTCAFTGRVKGINVNIVHRHRGLQQSHRGVQGQHLDQRLRPTPAQRPVQLQRRQLGFRD